MKLESSEKPCKSLVRGERASQQGIHPKIVQERLGHASIQVTLDTYSHVAPGLQEAAAVRFDEAFISTPKKELVAKLG
jgi:integrase